MFAKKSCYTIFVTLFLSLPLSLLFASAEYQEEVINEGSSDEQAEATAAKCAHCFADFAFKNDYVTPRGLLVSNTDLTVQVLFGVNFDIYSAPQCGIDNIFITAGIWNDVWTGQENPIEGTPFVGAWNEMDWWAGFGINFYRQWKFTVNFFQFLSPPHNFRPENHLDFTLYFIDEKNCWLPITFNPYVRLWWHISGDSDVVVGSDDSCYYFEIGALPTYEWKSCNYSIIWTVPTWLSFGQPKFWNGSDLAISNEKSHFGVFSTGLNAKIPLDCIVKACLGKWYVDVGFQYYYLINRNLLRAQEFTIGGERHRNIFVAQAGFGFTF